MPLADAPLALLAAALRDPQVVLRYQAKMVTVPGSDCLWWRGAVSGRGHGRFYLQDLQRGSLPIRYDQSSRRRYHTRSLPDKHLTILETHH